MNPTRKQILDLLLYFRTNKELVRNALRIQNANNYLIREELRKSVKCSNGRDNKVLSLHDDVSKQALLEFVSSLPDDSFVEVVSCEDYDGYTVQRMYAMYLAKEDDAAYLNRLKHIKSIIDAKTLITSRTKLKMLMFLSTSRVLRLN